jgi:hypothetical protein
MGFPLDGPPESGLSLVSVLLVFQGFVLSAASSHSSLPAFSIAEHATLRRSD